MFNPSRDQVRQFFRDTWAKYRAGQPLAGAETGAVELILRHPEYHALLENERSLTEEYTPERGETNPFLHLSLHLAIAEQVSIDQPAGIRAAYEKLASRRDPHAAEHVMLEALAEIIYETQRSGRPLDPAAYVDRVMMAATRD